MSKKVKIFVGIALGLAVVIGGITFLSGSPSSGTGTSTVQSGVLPNTTGGTLSTTAGGAIPGGPVPVMSATQTAEGANEFSGLLSNISTISLDTSIFQSPAYKALRDYPVLLGTDIIGRVNPFAPIGSDQGSGGTTTLVEVQTLAPGKITTTGAELGASVTLPDATTATIVFQYGISDTFGNTTTPSTIIKSGTTLATISGLLPGTKYFVQAIVVRGSSTTLGNVMNFTTTAAAGTAVTQ